MTEEDWLTSTSPLAMLAFLRRSRRLSNRKARLFAAAACRNVWDLLTDKGSRRAVEVAERYADGLVAWRRFHSWGWLRTQRCGVVALFKAADAAESSAEFAAGLAAHEAVRSDEPTAALWETEFRAAWARRASVSAATAAADAAVPEQWVTERESARRKERRAQTGLARDIFANPFRPLPLVEAGWLAWNDGVVVKLATAIYEERAFERMPLLADALEDAGCADTAILAHCRGGGEHVRGCWVLDLLLGKE